MSRRRRGRVTVQNQPTGAARGMMRLMGAVHAVFGFVFVVIAITEIIPGAGLFGLPFLAAGAFFCINGIRLMVSKNGVAHRVGYEVESDLEQETIVGILDDVDKMAEEEHFSPTAADHDHISSIGPDPKARLEQLERLKEAGLITSAEYREKRAEILSQL